MRVLYRRLPDHTFLEVVAGDGSERFEYPGPVAIRPRHTLEDARRPPVTYLRPVVEGDTASPQVARPHETNEVRVTLLRSEDAIIHNSWAREPKEVLHKSRSSSHRKRFRTELYYWWTWRLAPLRWRRIRNFHPLYGGLWPRLDRLDVDLSGMVLPEDLDDV